MNRGQIKANIRQNLSDVGVNHFTETDLNESFQDAYDDIAVLTQCIVKRVTINWVGDLSYYDFRELGVTDYLATLAIFNNVTSWYLRDDLNIRDFDRIRRDWENWNGTPQFWAPCSPNRIAICGKYPFVDPQGAFNGFVFSNAYFVGNVNALGSFDLVYAAIAPTATSDATAPLIAADMQTMFEHYCTADLLEQDQEFIKASAYWIKYYANIEEYKTRVKKLAKTDLLLRV